ncbi:MULTISPECIES: hypothetical protein [unclassified Caballeronia]|uniref:hypothetical protein n=1 Tax=unclassified Caballeronia TaxID=2646786 RepID=UPI00285E67AA|nr:MULTISPECIES: hypothetical protein [unclassified Caballeronia]MDR5752747.1 hypothetical protein [Caballeronia sp. LZ024]MDR5841389.1 hypothetical protein [Caballeronia sp. LZ031]
MKSRPMLMLLSTLAAASVSAQTVSTGAVTSATWAANPAGAQPMPNAPPLTLLSFSGAVPLRTAEGGKCLLVARRGTQIVAVELSPVVNGPAIVGWTPRQIDMNTLTSKWGYHAAQGNAVTNISAWNANVDAHRKDAAQTQSVHSVTVNGKTYRQYSQFKDASAKNASDEYLCE